MSWVVGLLGRSRQALSRRAVLLDVLAAVVLTGAALAAVSTLPHDRTPAVTVVAALLCSTSVGWRRSAPAAAACVALTAVVVYQISGQDTQGAFISIAVVLTCYTAGRAASRWSLRAMVAGYALAACTAIEIDSGFSLGNDLLTWVPLAVVPIAAGVLVSRREGLVRELRAARARLQDEQDVVRARAVAEERTRVARELHDVIAHCVSVMVIQAGAARLLANSDLVAARDAMRVVVASGREALTDLRRIVGVRRRSDDVLTASSLGLAQLPALMERARGTGNPVSLHLEAGTMLPADVDLAVFRIVQEALTNVRKHAPRACVEVRVRVGADVVHVVVEDTGPAASSGLDGFGQGLVGMRERVAVHGGVLYAGPTQDGGFTVRARLPLIPPVATVSAAAPAYRAPPPRRRLTQTQVDALLSFGWLVTLEAEALTSTHRLGPLALNAVAVAALALAGVIRRRAPLVFLAIVGALTLTLSGGLASPQRASAVGTYALFICAYTVAAYCNRARAISGLGVMLAGVTGATVVQHASAGNAFGGGLMACAVWAAGRIVRNQREVMTQLRAAAARLTTERDTRALVSLADERMRIARDLHTIVARLVTGMVVQAEAAHDLLTTNRAAAVEAIATIEQSGRQGLVQLRQTLGVLRNRSEPAPRRPRLDERPTETRDVLEAVSS